MPFMNLKGLSDCKVVASDGEIGSVTDIYFDDLHWRIRYFVVDTGDWLSPGKVVLVSPHSIGKVAKDDGVIVLDLSKEQVKRCPDIDSDKPLSRTLEEALSNQYGWPMYWLPGMDGSFIALPGRHEGDQDGDSSATGGDVAAGDGAKTEEIAPTRGKAGDPNLRSVNEIRGYHIHAIDGEIGHVEDFLVEDQLWDIQYMVVDTRNWLPGKDVVVSRLWITDIGWSDRSVVVNVKKERVKTSPEYQRMAPIDRTFEEKLFAHYDLPRYWK